jgi:CYTH domain-containing protein
MKREIEVKLLVDGLSYGETLDMLKAEVLPLASSYVEGTSIDSYWKPVSHAAGKFLRMRVSSDDSVTLTSKVEDKGTIEDREEYETNILPLQKDSLFDSLVATMGDPIPVLWRFADFKLGRSGTTVSLIQNVEKTQWVFIEIEAATLEECTKWAQRLDALNQGTLKRVRNSFFDIFVMRNGVLL